MTTELTALTLAAILQMCQFGAYAWTANKELGKSYTLGNRDEEAKQSQLLGRHKRALNNHFEGLILFTIAALVVHLGYASNAVTQTCAGIYLGARILYVPAYVLGLTPARSIIWGVGFLATLIMLITALL
ncbi:MAPEG family protein [Thalassobius sp. I31.1]|uniref:MAPEG family protein n=1 Tax=Thalassobius sp. I31.1 TaxID=2109912 RepID=UPI000D1A88AD|nr:MAPEG family protein [Thalassobius sp. I31.1]